MDDFYMDDMGDDMEMDTEAYMESQLGHMSAEDIKQILEQYDDQLTPEIRNYLQSRVSSLKKSLVEYTRAAVPDLVENCVQPTVTQAYELLLSLFIMCLVFRLLCQISRIANARLGLPHSVVHILSATLGILALKSFFNLALVYLVICCGLSYLILYIVYLWRREWCGLSSAVFVVYFSILCELFVVEQATWHKIRGAQIILSMKVISLAVDVSKGNIASLPGKLEYAGYCFNIGTVIFGPWISYNQYLRLLDNQSDLSVVVWALKALTATLFAFGCLIHSNCLTGWLILDNAWTWVLAYRDAQSFRFSHYFISFLSDATATLSGISLQENSQLQWNVVRPQHIEIPRSLVEVVINWNLPMHFWLKTYVFKSIRPQGTFLAVILTYAASSLLHGLNFQLAAVLFSLGFYSYTEFVFRRRLSQIFDACVQARRCKEKCDHKYTSKHPLVIVTNLLFGGLAVFHLAYLGLMFDSSDGEDKGYTMWHTLDKWSGLKFLSHWVALGTFIFYWLI